MAQNIGRHQDLEGFLIRTFGMHRKESELSCRLSNYIYEWRGGCGFLCVVHNISDLDEIGPYIFTFDFWERKGKESNFAKTFQGKSLIWQSLRGSLLLTSTFSIRIFITTIEILFLLEGKYKFLLVFKHTPKVGSGSAIYCEMELFRMQDNNFVFQMEISMARDDWITKAFWITNSVRMLIGKKQKAPPGHYSSEILQTNWRWTCS